MQGKETQKATLPKQQQLYFLPPRQARSTFPTPNGDTVLIMTALAVHDLIMTAFSISQAMYYICFCQ